MALSSRKVLELLQKDPNRFRHRVAQWMKACVVSMEGTCQASVQTLPRRFGKTDVRLDPLPLSKTERGLARYDGGSELEALREEGEKGAALSEATQRCLQEEDSDTWCRPRLPERDAAGEEVQPGATEAPRESVYTKRLNAFSVSRCPSYRRVGTMRLAAADPVGCLADEESAAVTVTGLSSADWEKLFGEDVRRLATEILLHICNESCYKYTGANKDQICRHGFYYIVTLGDWRRRRRGKALRNALFVVKQSKYGMQGRVLHFQEHPFECISNHAGVAAMRCNLDVQCLRRVLPEEHWMMADDTMPHIGDRPGRGGT